MKLVKHIGGLLILTLGIAVIVNSGIGTSTWDSASAGMAELTGLSMGTWTFIIGVFQVIAIALITKTNIKYWSILVGLLTGVFIDMWLNILTSVGFGGVPILGLIGVVLMAVGIAMYTATGLPVNPIDNFMMGLVTEKNMGFTKAKIITDGIGLVCGFLARGPIGVGTFIIYFTLSPLIGVCSKLINRK